MSINYFSMQNSILAICAKHESTIIFILLQMRKLRHRQVKEFAPRLHSWKWQSQDRCPGNLSAKVMLSPHSAICPLERSQPSVWGVRSAQ